MADQSRSAHFQALFESALKAYERKTGITLAQHPLAVKLQSCHSVEDVTALLLGQAKAFSDFQANNRITKAIETTVSILTPLSDATSLADAVGLVRQKRTDDMYRIPDRFFSGSIPSCESNTGWSRYPTWCMCRPLLNM
jgi:hypothetical protein